jgi:hypothetical protein
MGIGFVLIIYAVVLFIAAAGCSAILVAFTHSMLKHTAEKPKSLIRYAKLLPFARVVYAGVWFIAYAAINDSVFHRDPMLGDSWYTPLPNGYSIEMIDGTDSGAVYNPKTQPGTPGIIRLQLDGPFIYGSFDHNWFDDSGKDKLPENGYFLMDTATNKRKDFTSYADLSSEAIKHNTSLNLRPINEVYQQYRMTWFDYTAGILLILIPLAAFLRLLQQIWRLRALQQNILLSA